MEYLFLGAGLCIIVAILNWISDHGKTPGILQDVMPPEPRKRISIEEQQRREEFEKEAREAEQKAFDDLKYGPY